MNQNAELLVLMTMQQGQQRQIPHSTVVDPATNRGGQGARTNPWNSQTVLSHRAQPNIFLELHRSVLKHSNTIMSGVPPHPQSAIAPAALMSSRIMHNVDNTAVNNHDTNGALKALIASLQQHQQFSSFPDVNQAHVGPLAQLLPPINNQLSISQEAALNRVAFDRLLEWSPALVHALAGLFQIENQSALKTKALSLVNQCSAQELQRLMPFLNAAGPYAVTPQPLYAFNAVPSAAITRPAIPMTQQQEQLFLASAHAAMPEVHSPPTRVIGPDARPVMRETLAPSSLPRYELRELPPTVTKANASHSSLGPQLTVSVEAAEDGLADVTSNVRERLQQAHETFPKRLYRLIMDCERNGQSHIIEFCPSGLAFFIRDPKGLTERIAPAYFRHQKIDSLRRQ